VSVYEHDDLTTVARVGGSGTIRLPLVGEVKAKGRTVGEITKRITDLYADGYLIDPQVSIFIKEFQSQDVTILGQVSRPGLYKLTEKTTLLELISKAGGLTEDAGKEVTLQRKSEDGAGSEKIERLDLTELVENGRAKHNVAVRDGDKIFVSKKEKQFIYVTGEVKKPDSYEYEEGLTLIHAITIAGGLSKVAAPSRIKVIRMVKGQRVVLEKVNMDAPVYPEDVIVVPESFF
jgi:polysaccharide export outer membrane protein